MADNKIEVQIDLDKKPAEKTGQAFRKDQQKLNQQLLTDAELTERAQTLVIERENTRRLTALVERLEGVKKETAKAFTELEVKEQAQTAFVQRENQKRIQAELARLEGVKDNSIKALTQTEVDEQARTRIIQRENERRINDLVRATEIEKGVISVVSDKDKAEAKEREAAAKHLARERAKAAKQAGEVEEDSLSKGRKAFAGLGKSVGSFAVQMVGLQSAEAIVGKIVDNFAKANEMVLNSVESLAEYREGLLELAALKDNLGNTTDEVKSQLLFRAETLQTKADATAFQSGFMGAAESIMDRPGRPGLMSDKELDQFMKMAAQFQAAEGGDAATHANLAGLIPQNAGGKRIDSKEAFGKLERLYSIFKPGIFDSFSSAAGQYAKLTPMIMNKVYSDMEGAALMSAFSTQGAGAESGTMTEWFTRATVGALGRKGVSRVENAEAVGETYKRLGATNQMTPMQMGDLIVKAMNDAEKKAKAQGLEFNAYEWLKLAGFSNEQDQKAMMAYRGASNSGQLETFFDIARDPIKGEAAARIKEFRERDMVGIRRRVDLEGEAAKITEGAKTEYYDTLMRHAFNTFRATNPGEFTGEYEDYIKDFGLGGRRRLHQIAGDLMVNEYQRVGGKTDRDLLMEQLNPGFGPGTAVGNLEMAERFNDFRDLIMMKGGSALPGGNAVGDAIKAIDDNVMPALKKPAAPAGPPPAAPGPQAMFMGHRGAIASLLVGAVGDGGGDSAAALPPPPGSADGAAVDNGELVQAMRDLIDAVNRNTAAKGGGGFRSATMPPSIRR